MVDWSTVSHLVTAGKHTGMHPGPDPDPVPDPDPDWGNMDVNRTDEKYHKKKNIIAHKKKVKLKKWGIYWRAFSHLKHWKTELQYEK